ncbi:RsmF rRNA methyltransferase first C-terminal domain-containing protein [Faecalicoccus pleomorphus]|uniref:RsmB/NOP family class I SAM-dependent RNA methyltransferase n=1 Tax=Faecalicoccus pleomorphus TaxID=1323 RepID=A0AAW6CUG8_9FIRM|nr:RsmB/NOP family class I SAM-dependent RNA methyltransferase [Faecalicoccus pleomorphus]MDB7980749.1 RsmB/NOP family class I SAM-dependent RNA methyltransferase [Faecalicoccus pleomorphus]MDB7982956.1 RsmB/NOP family class I SAM-dependent RNA methyltransferase [Faecalicoccus pleomorphus]
MSIQLPENYIQQMKELLKDDFEAYMQSFEQERYYGLRINTNKISVEDFLKISPFPLEPIPWTDNGFYYQGDKKPAKHPYYYAGLYYLQEPSAMLPAQILPIEEGEYVLDTCAAPGGKSTELAAKLQNTGLLLSNDISTSRCQGLIKNLELSGSYNTWVCSEDLIDLSKRFAEIFDKILVDAPCSGEGMFRKEPHLISSWQERDDTYYPPIQKEILSCAIDMLKPGGMIVYSTCTFSTKENEEVIQDALHRHSDLHLVPIPKQPGFSSGIGMEECVRLFPHKIKGEGHFVALLQKEGNASKKVVKKENSSLPGAFKEFLKICSFDFSKGCFSIKNDKIIWSPQQLPEQRRWRLLRSGLICGEIKKNHFEPSQAFALALKKSQFKNTVDLSVDDPRVIKYLKGETIDIKDRDTTSKGWILVCVDGFPLGFGKIDKGIIKNKYSKGWRWQ